MLRFILICVTALLLPACATRGAVEIDCPGFRGMVNRLPESPLIRDIQSDVESPQVVDRRRNMAPAPSTPLSRAMAATVRRAAESSGSGPNGNSNPISADVLLLSGGGQWGAFGAGFFERLHQSKPELLPRPRVITGVSTGALQAFYLALASDSKYSEMRARYQPRSESEIVDRHRHQEMAAVTGSMAGLKPLKRRIEEVLCTNGDPTLDCPHIAALATEDGPEVYVGFVEAETGDFLYADIRALARLSQSHPGAEGRRLAQQCLAGAALSSIAMPVFFQQVRVDGQTYYDGGVRQSLFEAEVAREMREAAVRFAAERLQSLERDTLTAAARLSRPAMLALATSLMEQSTPTIYAVRNGPTIVVGESKPDRKADALTNALRAERIVVNELEVGSIAEIRLAHPTGLVKLITADGWDKVGHCVKEPADAMFSPDFMNCLIQLGRMRAGEGSPWRTLREIPYRTSPGSEVLDLLGR